MKRNILTAFAPISLITLMVILLFAHCQPGRQDGDDRVEDNIQPVDLVEPLVDAANARWLFFGSATMPFGMVNLSPDMVLGGAWNAGYQYNIDTIRSFSHIHAWQLSGIPVLPVTGDFKGHLGPDTYGSLYSHEDETVEAGYHQVRLLDYDINAELTASTRVGFHKYTFPAATQSHILFDFSTFLGPSDTHSGTVKMVSNTEIEGMAAMAPTRRRPKITNVFFVAVFDKPFESFGAWQDGSLLSDVREIDGARTGAFVTFPTEQGEVRMMKVGISYVSAEQARLNLRQEVPHWDFEKVRTDTRRYWNDYLSRIEVDGGTETVRRRFYTDLWHALQGRRTISDVNGMYCDMTGPEPRTGQIPLDAQGKPKFNHYNSDSFWGAQWTLNTLWHLVYPEVAEGFVNSMVMMYKDGGLIPRGPSGGNYTYVMTGASSTPFIVSAYMKGLRNFDVETAYEGLRKNHMPGGIMSKAGYEHNTNIGGGLDYYIERGYIPHPLSERNYGFHQDGSGQTLEYAYQDWTLAQMAKALGKDADYTMFMERTRNYRNIWYDSLGWMWMRNLDGNWAKPIDILQYGNGWVEGNAAQFTWWVPQDVQGLIGLIGGRDAFSDKLNRSFEMAREHDFVSAKSHSAGETRRFRRRYINYGNQPCMQTAFMFNYSGAPWLTQYWSRQVIDKVYSGVSPQYGYSGDEDQGLMGSLAVLMKIGLFSMKGGTAIKPVYEIASPIFDRITIHLNPDYYPGGTFTIAAVNNGAENVYVQQAKLNGETLDKAWFYHEDMVAGGTLELQMGKEPNKSWGSDPELAPPGVDSN